MTWKKGCQIAAIRATRGSIKGGSFLYFNSDCWLVTRTPLLSRVANLRLGLGDHLNSGRHAPQESRREVHRIDRDLPLSVVMQGLTCPRSSRKALRTYPSSDQPVSQRMAVLSAIAACRSRKRVIELCALGLFPHRHVQKVSIQYAR